ncbi:hypothetical protein [Legionella anisa]|uniref:hypothetical protein n=1 Tax=Legionella anisa TaxID=28082 RepID=UPI002242FA72|nr:hypothetical protein [Legionella anisa]MCW8447556.1 hypothetical protein [Legionella anisa]
MIKFKNIFYAALPKGHDYFQRHGTDKLDLSKKEDVKQFMKEYILDVLYTPKDQVKKLLKTCMRFGSKTEGGFDQELLIRNSKYYSTKTVSRAGASVYVSYEGYKYYAEKQIEKQSKVLRDSLEQGVQYSSERLEDLDKLQQKQLKAIDSDVKKLKLVLKQESQYQLALEAIQGKESVHEDKEVQAIMVRYLTKTRGMIFNDFEAAERKLKERLDKITSRKERINNRIIESEQHLDSLQEFQSKEKCNLDNLENLEKLSNSFQKMF